MLPLAASPSSAVFGCIIVSVGYKKTLKASQRPQKVNQNDFQNNKNFGNDKKKVHMAGPAGYVTARLAKDIFDFVVVVVVVVFIDK